jgi:hypothetical protein
MRATGSFLKKSTVAVSPPYSSASSQGRSAVLRVSIVLPFVKPCEQFERTLASVLAHQPVGAETIVALSQDYEDPFGLSGEIEILKAATLKTRVDLANFAALHATGDVIAVVSGPVEVEAGWCEAALSHFETSSEVFSVSPTILDGKQRERVASAGLEYRASGYCGEYARGKRFDRSAFRSSAFVGPSLAAGFYRRNRFLRLGGFSPRWGDAAADLDLSLRAADLGWISALEPNCRAVAFGKLRPASAFEQGRVTEELYRRRLELAPSTLTTLRHRALLAHECLTGFAAPRRWLSLAGRMSAKRVAAPETEGVPSDQTSAKRTQKQGATVLRIDAAHTPEQAGQPLAPRSRSERIRLAVRNAERRAA